MKNGMVIIDADGHAVDNEAVYRERLPEQYRKRNFIVSSDGFDRGQNGTIMKQPKDAAQNLADNDREGIDLQIIYPTGGRGAHNRTLIPPPGPPSRPGPRDRFSAPPFCQPYNDWLYDWCSADKK